MLQWLLCCQMLKRLVVDPAASTVVLDGFVFLNWMGFLQRKMLMQMSEVTIPRESLGCTQVDCLQQNYFTSYQHRPAQLPVLAWMINEHHNWRAMKNMNDGIIYLKAGLLIP